MWKIVCACALIFATPVSAEEQEERWLGFVSGISLFASNCEPSACKVHYVSVKGVVCGGPFDKAAIKQDDMVLAIEGHELRGMPFGDLKQLLNIAATLKEARFTVVRMFQGFPEKDEVVVVPEPPPVDPPDYSCGDRDPDELPPKKI